MENLLNALEAFGAKKEKSAAEKRQNHLAEIRGMLITRALEGDCSMLPNPASFEVDVKSFIEGLNDEVIEAGVNIYFGAPSGSAIHNICYGLGFDLVLEDSVETSKRKYTLKVHKRDVRWNLKNYFRKVVRMEETLVDAAVGKFVANLTEDGHIQILTNDYEEFMERVKNGEGELFALDDKIQDADHIALGLISKGKCHICVSGLRARAYPLEFKCRKE